MNKIWMFWPFRTLSGVSGQFWHFGVFLAASECFLTFLDGLGAFRTLVLALETTRGDRYLRRQVYGVYITCIGILVNMSIPCSIETTATAVPTVEIAIAVYWDDHNSCCNSCNVTALARVATVQPLQRPFFTWQLNSLVAMVAMAVVAVNGCCSCRRKR